MNHPIRREDPVGQVPVPVTNLPDSEPISIQDGPQTRAERGERTDITRTPHSVGGAPRTLRTQLIEATKALAANQREHALGLAAVKTDLAAVKTDLDDFRQETRATFRSVDEQLAEIKDLIIGRPGA